jgi:hypothetical protein
MSAAFQGVSMENITPPMPAKRALAVLDQPAVTDIGPPKRISPKVRAAIDAMVSGECKNITEAGAKVGLARESLSRALSLPHIAEHRRQKVLRHLAIHAARAGATKVDLSSNEMARDRASTFVLGLAGIQPAASPSLNVNIEVKAGYVIDLSDDPAPMRTVSPPVGDPNVSSIIRVARCYSVTSFGFLAGITRRP